MTTTATKLRALCLVTVTVFAMIVGPVSVGAETLSGGNTSLSAVGNAEDVDLPDASIDSSTTSDVQVAYETDLDPSNVAVEIRNVDTGDVIGFKDEGISSKSDVVTVTLGSNSMAGVPSSGTVTARAVLVDNRDWTQKATDDATLSVDSPPSIVGVNLDEDDSGNLVLSFSTDEPLGTDAGDVTVTVDGPNTVDAYTFDRSQFAESGTGPFTYTLAVTQAYDDGDGTYGAVVDVAKDSAGLDGGDGSAATYDYGSGSDTTAPTISSVTFVESSGDMDVSFESDEQLGSSAGDVTVTVAGPNGASYAFDRTQFTGGPIEGGGYLYSLSASQAFDDGDGTYGMQVEDAKDATGNNGGTNGAGTGLTASVDYSSGPDTTAPTISNVAFGSTSGGDMVIQFDSSESLGSNAGDVTVAVDGPNTADAYAFDRTQFTESGAGPYTYTLSASQAFDDGDGTYTADVNDAKDAAGNNGGNDGEGSGLSARFDTSSGGGGGDGDGDGGGDGGEGGEGGGGGGISYPDAPSVQFHTTDIDSSSLTSIFVTYNASGQVASTDDIELWFFNATKDPNTPVAKRTSVEAAKGLTTITIPQDALGAGDFDGKIALVDTGGDSPSVLTSSSNKIVVYTGVSLSVSRTTLTDEAGSGIDVTYDLGNIEPKNAEIEVAATTLDSGFTTLSQSLTGKSETGTITLSQQASDINRNFTIMAYVRDTSRSRQVQSSITRSCVEIAGSPCPTVVSSSVENAATGQPISGVGVATDWNWFMTGVDWHLHPDGQPNNREIDGVSGVDSSTMLRVNLTVSHFDPLFLLGNARAKNWSTTQVDSSKTRVTYYVTPADAYWHDQVRNPDPTEWPLANASATTHYDAIVDMTQVSLEGSVKDSFREKLRGGMVATDAQAFAPPRYTAPKNGNPGELKIGVGSPHFQTDGASVNRGFYRAIIPSGIVSDWGIDATQLSGDFEGEDVPLSVVENPDGTVTVDADIHYSSGTVTLTGDSDKPVADAGSDRTVDEGSAVTLDGTSSSDNGAISKYEWDVDGDDTYDETGSSISHTYDSAGSRTVTLRVTDDGGKTATDTVTIDVQAVSSGSGSGSGSSGDSGSSGSSGGGDTTADSGPSVLQTGTDTSVTVDSGSSGTVAIDQQSRSGAVGIDTLAVETGTADAYDLDVSAHDDNPGSMPTPDASAVGTAPLGYVQVEHTVPDEEIDGVSFEFSVSAAELDARGLDPGDVALYRGHDDSWDELPTTYRGLGGANYRFESASPGLSTFAVGVKRTADISVASAGLADGGASATVGEPVTVTATVENTGTAAGTTTVELAANGTTYARQNVSLAAGETATVDLAARFDTAGTYDLRIGGQQAGTVTVEAVATDTATATPESEEPVTNTPDPTATATATGTVTTAETTAGSGPGFGPFVAVLALLVAAGAMRRRRD